jgi:hypothetical protein
MFSVQSEDSVNELGQNRQVTAVPASGFLEGVLTATCRPNVFASMARTIENVLKSVRHVGDTPWQVAPPDDLHDETLENEFGMETPK